MSATSHLSEVLTRHQIFLQRFASGQVKAFRPLLEELRQDLLKELSLFDTTDVLQIQAAIEQINIILETHTPEMQEFVSEFSEAIIDYEAGFYQRALGGVVSAEVVSPSKALLIASASNKRMRLISGGVLKNLTLAEAVKIFSDGMATDVANTIRTGIVNGMTHNQITRNVSMLVKDRSRAQAGTLVRTIVNHVTAQTRENINKETFGLYEELFIATLDSNTTITCASFDGQTFRPGEGPQPPLHYGCRSLRSPKVPDEFALPGFEGVRPTVVDGVAEQVSAKTTYAGFLKAQSKEFQDEVLGVERAKLFRSGEVTLDKFTDDVGRVLSLDELRQREALTF